MTDEPVDDGLYPEDGPRETFWPNGHLSERGTYWQGEWRGPYEHYLDDGQLMWKGTYAQWGIECGEWFKEGDIVTHNFCSEVGTTTDEIKDGPFETRHDNGQLCEKGTYKDGKLDGPFEWYHNNGELAFKMTYKHGKLDGPAEGYFYGELATKGIYKDHKKCGEWLEEGETVTYDPCP